MANNKSMILEEQLMAAKEEVAALKLDTKPQSNTSPNSDMSACTHKHCTYSVNKRATDLDGVVEDMTHLLKAVITLACPSDSTTNAFWVRIADLAMLEERCRTLEAQKANLEARLVRPHPSNKPHRHICF